MDGFRRSSISSPAPPRRGRIDSIASTNISGSSLSAMKGKFEKERKDSTRDEFIDKYMILEKQKRDLARRDQRIQTKIAQYIRKHKIEISQPPGLSLTGDDSLKSEYNRYLQQLQAINEAREKDTSDFETEMAGIQQNKKSLDREIRNTESQLEGAKNRVLKTSRDSRSGAHIHPQYLHDTNKKLAQKEAELRKLRLEHIKVKSKLEKLDVAEEFSKMDSAHLKRESLWMENSIYNDKLEESTDQISGIKHRIAGNVVMMSHLALKLHYLKEETGQLEFEENALSGKIMDIRKKLLQVKGEKQELLKKKSMLEEKAGLLNDFRLLADFKDTAEEFQDEQDNNEKLLQKLNKMPDILWS